MKLVYGLLTSAAITLALSPAIAAEKRAEEKKTLDTVIVTAESEADDGAKGALIAQEATVGKSDVPIVDQPRSVSVITAQRMDDMGVDSVQDALLYTSGVYGGTYGDDTRGDWSVIRGSDPVTFIDGLQSTFGYYNNARPNAYAVERVEILKGPASVEYGQGTVGGIVNLVSKLPQAESFREVTAEYGSFNHKRVGADVTGKIDDQGEWLYRLVTSVQDADHQTNFVENDQITLNPSLTWNATDSTSLTVLANIQDNHSGTGTQFLPHQGTIFPAPNGPIPRDVFISEPGWDKYDTDQQAVTLIGDHDLNANWSLHGAARYMQGASEYFTMYPVFPPAINPDGRTLDRWVDASEGQVTTLTSDLHLNGKFETGSVKHTLATGLDYQHAKTDSDSFFDVNGGTIDLYTPVYGNIPVVTLTDNPYTVSDQHGLYINDSLTLFERVILALGLRGDKASTKSEGGATQDDTAITKNAGLMYKFDNGVSPYVSYAESFTPIIGADIFNNPFDPKEGIQYEAGVKYQPKGTKALLTAAVFEITEQNRLTSDPTTPGNSIQTGEVEIQGLELEAQFALGDFDFLTTYTHMETEISKSNNGDQGFNLSDVPDNMASAWVTYRPSNFWEGFKAGAGVRYVGESWDGSDTFQRPSFTVGDAMIGYELKEGWDVALNVHNITDEQYVGSCLARGDCFLGESRTVMLNVTKRF